MKKFLVLNGPNLNLLGVRQPDIYGTETLDSIESYIESYAARKGFAVEFAQSNHEGYLIDKLQSAMEKFDGVVFNPGAYTHYSYALRDAVSAIGIPVAEVHLSDINARESFRAKSVIAPVCIAQISGKGKLGYIEALDLLNAATSYAE
ncbi:MAG: type II 3-dehydroquinate dehydratase [Eggerthellaceae bacterium]|nr:type II 3-dehydroquinate dehydratase [Eggerthellaceae bacterium]